MNGRNKILRWRVLIGFIIVIFVTIWISLPWFIARNLRVVLSEIPDYQATIGGIRVHPFKGGYSIDSLKIYKQNGNENIPFIVIPLTDFSIEWSALFDGALVGEIIFNNPEVNFIGGFEPSGGQSGEGVDWIESIRRLVPFKANRLEASNAVINFYDLSASPNVKVSLWDMDILATNLRNTSHTDAFLPALVKATGISTGGGAFQLSMDVSTEQKIPDAAIDLQLENVNMTEWRDFFLAYSQVEIKSGSFNLYSEIYMNDGLITGFVIPEATNIEVTAVDVRERKAMNQIWLSIVGFFSDLLEKREHNQFATKVPLSGNLNVPETKVWPTVWNTFSNGFVKAFEQKTDNTIHFFNKNTLFRSPQELRKEAKRTERKERRQRRKKINV